MPCKSPAASGVVERAQRPIGREIGVLPEDRRNVLWLTFADPGFRRKLVQWEERAR